jgi:hypothetical protein
MAEERAKNNSRMVHRGMTGPSVLTRTPSATFH